MRIRLGSDFHLEQYIHATVPLERKWDTFILPPLDTDSESVLVLAGDICEFVHTDFYSDMWCALSQRFKAVLYVPGNHEYWDKLSPRSNHTFFYYKDLLRSYGKNIHLLDNSGITIDGNRFYGTSLWTNYKSDPLVIWDCANLHDFRYGYTGQKDDIRVTAITDFIEWHEVAINKLRQELSNQRDVTIVSHFAPSYQSTHDRYKDAGNINYHFVNDLDQLILDNPQIKLWVHGHTHSQFDYNIGETRVVCNPIGYTGEIKHRNHSLDVLEVNYDL